MLHVQVHVPSGFVMFVVTYLLNKSSTPVFVYISYDYFDKCNMPFPSCPLSPCQNKYLYETIHMEICFKCKELCTRTCFETEAHCNSEVVYFILVFQLLTWAFWRLK